MEKFNRFRDAATGIQPFLVPVVSFVLSWIYHNFNSAFKDRFNTCLTAITTLQIHNCSDYCLDQNFNHYSSFVRLSNHWHSFEYSCIFTLSLNLIHRQRNHSWLQQNSSNLQAIQSFLDCFCFCLDSFKYQKIVRISTSNSKMALHSNYSSIQSIPCHSILRHPFNLFHVILFYSLDPSIPSICSFSFLFNFKPNKYKPKAETKHHYFKSCILHWLDLHAIRLLSPVLYGFKGPPCTSVIWTYVHALCNWTHAWWKSVTEISIRIRQG